MKIVMPVRIFNRITDIPVEYLVEKGIKGIAVDADNTLSEHHSPTPIDSVTLWLEGVRSNGIKIIMVSNSKTGRALPFAALLGLDCISTALKPLPFGLLRAKRRMAVNSKQLAVIGDQLFTDMLGANMCGAVGILVTPIKEEDGFTFKIRRYFEKKILKKYGDLYEC